MKSEPKKKKNKGCVLWIALAVLGIMILSGMMMPALCQASEKSRRINCAGNLKQIGLAIIIYAGDDVKEGMLPSGGSFRLLNQQKYLVDGKVYVCPSATHPNTLAGHSNYVYCGAGLSDTDSEAARTVIAYDRGHNHSKWKNFLFLDGHVKGTKQRRSETVADICRREGWILPPHDQN
jgi:prepilin-type processing-associated H-X9-DG protein